MPTRALLALLILGGCARAGADPPAAGALADVLLAGVPHVRQKPDFCGEACVAMWLGKLGKPGDQDWVFDQSGLDPLLGRGVWSAELLRALTRIGFRAGPGFYPLAAGDARGLDQLFRGLHADLAQGVPSIVCMRTGDGPSATEHFRLVLGYDGSRDEIIYHEPAEDGGAYRRMPRARFLELWPLKYAADRWTVVRFRLDADRVAGGTPSRTPTAADYAQHVMALRARLPPGFAVAMAPPFVVVGDGGEAAVQRAAEKTVAWAVRRLKESYFQADPDEILDIWLFKDAPSYRRHAKELFDDEPTTPYGYYSPSHRALIMNISTGGGTLVHEIVHPFVRADFPEAPAWLNEGLGSLFEQSGERDGRIVGYTNWRLAGLKTAIRAGRLPTFRALTASDSDAFYAGETSYAQARYLLYYLQEKGLLADFYRRFRGDRARDPTGYSTLVDVLGERDMAAFQRRWQEWVLALEFAG
jgi:hypothetical protein